MKILLTLALFAAACALLGLTVIAMQSPPKITRHPHGDAQHPGAQRRALLEPGQPPVDDEKHLLGGVVDAGVVDSEAREASPDRVELLGVDRVERRRRREGAQGFGDRQRARAIGHGP